MRSARFPLAACLTLLGCDPGTGATGTERDAHPGPSVSQDPERACGGCHPSHVEEWRISPHAYAMRDPVFHAMVRLGQRETEGEMGDFCVSCHSPIGATEGETKIFVDESTGFHRQLTEGLSTAAMAGVSCEVCHSIVSVEQTANAQFTMQRDGVRRATIRDPAANPAHESAYSPLHAEASICGTCHQVVNDFGLGVERTHLEWVQSRFNGAQSCQDCHMPAYEGPAAAGHKARRVHRHTFVGVDVSLLPEDEFPGFWEMRTLAEELLQRSATLTAAFDATLRVLEVNIENKAGHALPSGATMDREMWLELRVLTEGGALVFESGTLDENGDLRVDDPHRTTRPGTDPALVLYTQHLFFDPKLEDPASAEPMRGVEFLWEPNVEESRLVFAGGRDRPSYRLDDLPAGRYEAHLRLLFRTFPPHLLRRLEREAGLDPAVKGRVPIVEMQAIVVPFAVN